MFDAHAHLRLSTVALRSLLTRMDALGISRAVVVGGGLLPPDKIASNSTRPVACDISFDHSRFESLLLGTEARLFPFFFGNPISGFAEYQQRGGSYFGLKLAPAIHGVPFADPRLAALLELAESFSHPVYLHCLAAKGFQVKDLVRLAKKFCNVNFILGHGGIGHMDFAAVDLILDIGNIFFETSGGYLAVSKYAYERLGAKRMLFGSEFPLQDPEIEQTKAKLIGMPPEDFADYTSHNIEKLLGNRLKTVGSDTLQFSPALVEAALDQAAASRFYRERFRVEASANYEAWRVQPYMSKDDLRAGYPFGLLATAKSNLATYHESTGTTGTPSAAFFTEGDWDDVVTRFLRNGIKLGNADTVLIKTPYSMVSTALQMHQAARRVKAMVIPADNRSSNMPYTKVIRLLKDLSVTVAWCLPSELALWASTATLLGLNPAKDFPSLRAFIVAGEPLSDAKRQRLQEIWGGKRIFVDYGSTETGSLAGECGSSTLHSWSDRLLFEILDPETGRTALAGRGELVVTSYFREGMPIIRYRTGDFVELTRDKRCKCGSALAQLKVFGRMGASLRQGEVHQVELERCVYMLPAEYGVLYWRGKPGADCLEIEIEAQPRFADVAADELSALVYQQLGVRTRVQVMPQWSIVDKSLLLASSDFKKPRYLFQRDESWAGSQNYL